MTLLKNPAVYCGYSVSSIIGLHTTLEEKKALGGFACFAFSFPGSGEGIKQALICSNAVKVTKSSLNSRAICQALLRHKCKQDWLQIKSVMLYLRKKCYLSKSTVRAK